MSHLRGGIRTCRMYRTCPHRSNDSTIRAVHSSAIRGSPAISAGASAWSWLMRTRPLPSGAGLSHVVSTDPLRCSSSRSSRDSPSGRARIGDGVSSFTYLTALSSLIRCPPV